MKIYEKFREIINKNMGRKLTVILVPIVCAILIISLSIISHMYSVDLIQSIEERTQYTVENSKLNMDHQVNDVKNPLNVLSNNSSIKELTKMDMDHIDYEQFLRYERTLKSLINAYEFPNNYVQDLIIVGKNGYQFSYMNGLTTNIMETEWFQKYVDQEELGFQYILPHNLDYFSRKPSCDKAISILLPIKESGQILGYIIADMGIENLLEIPDVGEKKGAMKTYFVDKDMNYAYDFIDGRNEKCTEEEFVRLLSDKEKKFATIDNDFVAYTKMSSSGWYIIAVYDYEDVIRSVKRIQNLGIMMILVSCIAIFVVSHLMAGYVEKSLNEILERIKTVESQNFEAVIPDYRNQPGEVVQIRKRFEEMIQQINDLVNRVYLDEIYQKEMKYEQLVNQINPHFLYNVMQLIQSKAVLSDNFEINDIVVTLSKLMRYNMGNQNKIVTVREECNYVENYLSLYTKRYSGKFTYDIQMESGLAECQIIKFLIQPVVENSIKHGFKNLKREGLIRIRIMKSENKIKISVWDNGNGITKEKMLFLNEMIKDKSRKKEESIGLRNTYQRMILTYGEEAKMKILSKELEYTEIICMVPEEEDHV